MYYDEQTKRTYDFSNLANLNEDYTVYSREIGSLYSLTEEKYVFNFCQNTKSNPCGTGKNALAYK